MKNNPIAVVISDIHFNLQNLELATEALCSSIETAQKLHVPLVIAGDLHDTKALLRGEILNRFHEIFSKDLGITIYFIVGNHDLLNEKQHEHSLNFLKQYGIHIITVPSMDHSYLFYMFPYYTSSAKLLEDLSYIPKNSICIMHQGFLGAQMGEYIQDKSSLDPTNVNHLTVISGHYHKHQTLGTVTYIGSPYTITYAEANDGPKGYLVLYEDGSFERVILNLRKHIIIEESIKDFFLKEYPYVYKRDLVWIKLHGKRSELFSLDKKLISKKLEIDNYKLDFIINQEQTINKNLAIGLHSEHLMDNIIDTKGNDVQYNRQLKELYREIFNS